MKDEPAAGDQGEPATGSAEPASPSRTAYEHLSYVLSLPERVVRGGSGLVGGIARESAELLVPQSFQSSRTYGTMVRQMLDFMVHNVGGVPSGNELGSTAQVDNYVARKAVGNFLDMASMATLHISPLVILAAVSDVAYGSQNYLKELSEELKQQGVIESGWRIDHVNDLLGAVSHATAKTSEAFDTPPLSIEGLKQTLAETKAAIAAGAKGEIPSEAEVDRMWQQMRAIADREGVDLLAVSGATTIQSLGKFATVSRGALSTVRVAGRLFDKHVLDHYSQSLSEIQQKGFYPSIAASCEPYLAAVWDNFASSRGTITENLLNGTLIGSGLNTLRSWMLKSKAIVDQAAAPGPADPMTRSDSETL
jgi:hypothetical protein